MSDSNSNNKNNNVSKVVTAVLAAPVAVPLVALSGFMPLPAVVQSARAGSTTLSVTGSFITGMTLTKKADMKFGKMVSTGANGAISLTTAGAYAGSSKAVGITGKAAGKYSYKAATTKAALVITIKGIGKLTLADTLGGAKTQGTAKLKKILLGKAFGGTAHTCTVTGAGTSCKEAVTAGADCTKKSTTVNMGGVIAWGTPQPIGLFGQSITIIQSY